jgi:sugar (pentulose or hexulose) kinase
VSAADRVLAIDVGTQSVRALVVDPTGGVVAKGRIAIDPYVSPRPGWAEQDPDVWWTAIGHACSAVWATGLAMPGEIAGVALTTQRATVIVTDTDGAPLRPAIVWLDQRRAENVPEIGGAIGLAFRALGVRRTVAAFQADCEANWLRAEEPAVYRRIRRYVFLSGFLTQRLTGRWADSVAAQVGYVPFDYKRLDWARTGDWRWRAAPIDPTWLPELVPPGQPLGELTPEAATHLGLPRGLPLVAAAADKACEVLGSGAIRPEVASLSYGTTATINTTQRRYIEAVPLVPPYPAAIPGAWSLEVQVYRGYWLVDWFKRQFGAAEVAQADQLGIAPEALFDDLVRATEPGAMGLMVQPTWTPGVRIPGPEAKGAIVGFGDVHTRAHLYRAILEGLAYALREGGERAADRARTPLRELRVSGGGAQSPAAVQLTADIFGLPVGVPHTYETSGLGAAIDAAVGLAIHPSFEAAVTAMTRVAETVDPDPARHRLYDDLYRRVYRRLYKRLQPLYEEIMAITGYPPS